MYVNWRLPRVWMSRLRKRANRFFGYVTILRGRLNLHLPKRQIEQSGVQLGFLGVTTLIAGMAIPLGCSNNFNLNGLSNTILASNPNGNGDGSSNNAGAFTLSRVILNSLSPTDT
ncbi:MAG: hypothetical protein HYX41_02400, partial [Bdellovibrio sp.]|nr:hypothetical protein [Bdellovibrio sp.]